MAGLGDFGLGRGVEVGRWGLSEPGSDAICRGRRGWPASGSSRSSRPTATSRRSRASGASGRSRSSRASRSSRRSRRRSSGSPRARVVLRSEKYLGGRPPVPTPSGVSPLQATLRGGRGPCGSLYLSTSGSERREGYRAGTVEESRCRRRRRPSRSSTRRSAGGTRGAERKRDPSAFRSTSR